MRTRRGAILVLTLAVLTAVIAVLAGAAAMQQLATKAAINRSDQDKAKLMAESGLQRALASLASQNSNATTQNDDWYTLGTNGNDKFVLDQGSFRLQIVDANSLVNINTAAQDQLLRLPLTEEQVESLLDWRTTGAQARPNGAKDAYYNQLTYPYNASYKALQSLDELLLVKGFTPATLYQAPQGGVSTATQTSGMQQDQTVLYNLVTVDSISSANTPQGRPKTNVNTATQQQLRAIGIPGNIATNIITQRNRVRTFATLGDVLRVQGITTRNAGTLIDNLEVNTNTPTGKIDLNTVTEPILNTIPALPPDAVQGILQRQPNAGFRSVGELTNVPGITLSILQQTADLFTTGSRAFIVRVIGTSGTVNYPLEAVVTIGASNTPATGSTTETNTITGTVKVAKIYQTPYTDMIPYCNWQTNNTN